MKNLIFWSKFVDMRLIALLLTVFFIVEFSAQDENTSFYLKKNNIETNHYAQNFDSEWIGYYDVEDKDYRQLIIAADSISFRFGSPFSISKQAALSKGFTFDGEKMYGMAPYNGLYYTEENDTIYAMYYQYDTYLSSNSNFVKLDNNSYLLMLPEGNDLYSFEVLFKSGNSLSIYSIDHSIEMDKIRKFTTLEKQVVDGFDAYIASPTLEEVKRFLAQKGFNESRYYRFNTKL